MTRKPHRAGVLIRRYRHRHGLSHAGFAEQLAVRMGRSARYGRSTLENWELYGKIARPEVQRVLMDMGVCEASDWLHAPDPGEMQWLAENRRQGPQRSALRQAARPVASHAA